jgi:hypothetical protein
LAPWSVTGACWVLHVNFMGFGAAKWVLHFKHCNAWHSPPMNLEPQAQRAIFVMPEQKPGQLRLRSPNHDLFHHYCYWRAS